jgi:hypothetical protein
MDWSGQPLFPLGVCEKYESSAIGVVRARAAIRREQGLDAVLQPLLAEMREANQALRQEALGLLAGFAGIIPDATADVGAGR